MRRQRAADLGSRSYQERVILREETIPIVDSDVLWQDSTAEDTMEEVELVGDHPTVEQMEE